MTADGVPRGRRVLWRLLAALLAVLTGAVGALALYYTSVQPGAALMTAVFEQNKLVQPPAGFAAIARTVSEQRVAVPTAGAPTAYLDIYAPSGTGSTPRPVIFWVHGGGFIAGSAANIADYGRVRVRAEAPRRAADYVVVDRHG